MPLAERTSLQARGHVITDVGLYSHWSPYRQMVGTHWSAYLQMVGIGTDGRTRFATSDPRGDRGALAADTP